MNDHKPFNNQIFNTIFGVYVSGQSNLQILGIETSHIRQRPLAIAIKINKNLTNMDRLGQW